MPGTTIIATSTTAFAATNAPVSWVLVAVAATIPVIAFAVTMWVNQK